MNVRIYDFTIPNGAVFSKYPAAVTPQETEYTNGKKVDVYAAKYVDVGEYNGYLVLESKDFPNDTIWLHVNIVEPAPAPIYSVAGAEALMGAHWNEKTGNEMTKQDDGTYKLVLEDVTLAVGNYEYKVVIDHKWNNGEATSNSVLAITEAGKYDITFTYDPATPTTDAQATLKEALVVLPKVELAGGFNGWTATEMTPAEDKLTASLSVNIADAGDYEFKMVVASNWLANGYEYHRGFTGAEGITNNGDNMLLKADVAGDYVFTWTYATNGINITFPSATAIDNAEMGEKAVKRLENGQIFIIKNGVKYNVLGAVIR